MDRWCLFPTVRSDKQMFFNCDKCKVRYPRSHGDDDEDADDNNADDDDDDDDYDDDGNDGDDSGNGDVGESGYSGERGSGNDYHGFFAMMQASWWE